MAQQNQLHPQENWASASGVIVDGSMGFASTNSLESSQIRTSAETAVKTAKAAARLISAPTKLAPEKSWEDKWEARMKIDTQDVSIEEKFDVLFSIEKSAESRTGKCFFTFTNFSSAMMS